MNPVVQFDGNDNKATNNEKPINHWAEEDDSDNDSDYTPDGMCLTRNSLSLSLKKLAIDIPNSSGWL